MNLDPAAFQAEPELIQSLEKQSTPISCTEDRVLFRQGDDPAGLYILRAGEVTLTLNSPQGSEVASTTATAGSLLGLPGLIGDQPFTLSATAHAGAQASFLSRDSFAELMRTDPLLALKVLKVLAAEVRSARSAILNQRRPQKRRRSRLTPSGQA